MSALKLFRKVRGLLLPALTLALLFGSAYPALAQDEAPPAKARREPGFRWGAGVVTAIEGEVFAVNTRAGRDWRLQVDAATLFFDATGRPATYVDLSVGARVAGSVELRDDGGLYAVLVIIFPSQTRYAGVGVVTALEDDAFHFVSRRGRVWEFYVDAATTFTGRDGSPLTLADLQVETRLFVSAELRDDGRWWALEVKSGR
jgi:hypothetical protein